MTAELAPSLGNTILREIMEALMTSPDETGPT